MSPRKLTIQLAPLVDLLLVVTFLQFIEVQEKTEELSHRTEAAVVDRDEALARLHAVLADLARAQQTAESTSARANTAENQLATEQQRLDQAQTDLDRALAQQRVLGDLVTELFQIPSDEVAKIFDPQQSAGVKSPEEMRQLRETFNRLGLEKPGRMVEYLLSYEEIRKRCDVWEMHLDAQGIATVISGNRSTKIRVNTEESDQVAINRFADDLYSWYRTLPQPKSLVIILLTYDRNSRIFATNRVRQALPMVVARMQADSAGRTRFEYADLGFRIE